MPIKKSQLDQCIAFSKAYGATKLILFGSAFENPDIANDIDLTCDGIDGWKIYELGARLEELISVPVDLVPLKPSSRFTKYVERKGRVVYELQNNI